MCDAYAAYESDVDIKIVYVVKPRPSVIRVLACKDYAKGELVLVPLSPSVGANTKLPSTALPVSGFGTPAGTTAYIVPHLVLPKALGLPSCSKDKESSVVPYWCVPELEDEAQEGNMRPGVLKIQVDSSSSQWAESVARKTEVLIPVLINRRKVSKGEALIRSDPPEKEDAPKRKACPSPKPVVPPKAAPKSAAAKPAAAKKRQSSAPAAPTKSRKTGQ